MPSVKNHNPTALIIDFYLLISKISNYRNPPHRTPWGNKKSLVFTPWGYIEKKGFLGLFGTLLPHGLITKNSLLPHGVVSKKLRFDPISYRLSIFN